MNVNDYYRMYDVNVGVAVYFPDGSKYLLDSSDCAESFLDFTPEMVTESCFYFSSPAEAKKFEERVERLSQEYYYNVRGMF